MAAAKLRAQSQQKTLKRKTQMANSPKIPNPKVKSPKSAASSTSSSTTAIKRPSLKGMSNTQHLGQMGSDSNLSQGHGAIGASAQQKSADHAGGLRKRDAQKTALGGSASGAQSDDSSSTISGGSSKSTGSSRVVDQVEKLTNLPSRKRN